jgi:hypothetical protein
MDIDAIMTLVEAKRSECEDYTWTLREDPGFFEEIALSRSEHRQESVADETGQQLLSKARSPSGTGS